MHFNEKKIVYFIGLYINPLYKVYILLFISLPICVFVCILVPILDYIHLLTKVHIQILII